MSEVNSFLTESSEAFGTFGDDLEKTEKVDLLGSVLTVNGYRLLDSEFNEGKYAAVDFTPDNGGIRSFFTTASGVLIKQLTHNKENMPFKAGLEEKKSASSSYSYMTFIPITE